MTAIKEVTDTQGKTGPIVQVEKENIPMDIFIPCPKNSFKTARCVKNHCPGCKHFKGFEDVSPFAPTFERRYFVVCAFPITRRMSRVEIEYDA